MNFIAFGVAYNLFDTGLANVLGLESLRHGTNLVNFVGINLFGGLASHGAKVTGSTGIAGCSENRFYVFKDSLFLPENGTAFFGLQNSRISFLLKRLYAKTHTVLSGYHFGASFLPVGDSAILDIARKALGSISGLIHLVITPTLKFRYASRELGQFVNDSAYGNVAYYTTSNLPSYRLGITGSLFAGLNKDWPIRMISNPQQFGIGVVQLTAAIALTVFLIRFVRLKKGTDS